MTLPKEWVELTTLYPNPDGSDEHLYLTVAQSHAAFERLQDQGLQLPYFTFPGDYEGGHHSAFITSWRRWYTYTTSGWWNPPFGLKRVHDKPDPQASPPPTWEQIYEAGVGSHVQMLIQNHKTDIRGEAQRRITQSYGADDWQDEVQIRLRTPAVDLARMDSERERLRLKYKKLIANVSKMNTLFELQQLDIYDEKHWRD